MNVNLILSNIGLELFEFVTELNELEISGLYFFLLYIKKN